MEITNQEVDALRAIANKLEPHRKDQPIINDMFEAADDWRSFGELILKPSGFDISGRVAQEVELFDSLRTFYGAKLEQNPDFVAIMALGSRFIAAGKAYKPPPDGYLGSIRIVRETFAFLQAEFGLQPGPPPERDWDYESDRVHVHLDMPSEFDSRCRVTLSSRPSYDYTLEDLLFMGGRSVSMALPPGQELATEADVQEWFTGVADVLRNYGADVLADRPGAFERLAHAAAERERRYIEECERLYGDGASHAPENG